MAEPALIDALGEYIQRGTPNERDLAVLCTQLIAVGGDHEPVCNLISRLAVEALDKDGT